MALPIYASELVNISWGGVSLDGRAADSFVTFSRTGDITSASVGADRQTQISILPNRSGSCTLEFQQNSLSNRILAEILDDLDTNGRLRIADLTVSDPSGAILAELKNAHIMTAPEVSLGSDASGNTYAWVFYCETIRFTSSTATEVSDADRIRITASVDTIINI